MKMNLKWHVLSCVLAMNIAGTAMAGSIGINITTDRGGGVDSDLAPTDSTGYVAQTDWNNNLAVFMGDGNVHTFDSGALVGTDGETATIVNNNATGNWRSQNLNGTGAATNRLLDGFLESNDGTVNPVSLTVSGLDEAAFAGGYDVIISFTHDGNADVRTGKVGINGGSLTDINMSRNDGAFVTDSAGLNTYVFSGISGASFTVVAGGDDQANRFGVTALQIVPVAVPEPTSLALGFCGLAAVALRRRRV